MEDTFAIEMICANCQQPGKFACSSCRLVVYCGAECQKAHRTTHVAVCKSSLLKESWKPDWAKENRTPAFMGDTGPSQVKFGGQKYLWCNVPAFDFLKLEKNEGHTYDGDLNLLFAASGDMRNLVKTVAEVPNECTSKLSVVLNDRDFDVVARNIILLLTTQVTDEDEAIDCIIHIWYSAFIAEKHAELLAKRIRPLLEDVNEKIKDKSSGPHRKTFHFGSRSICVTLKKQEWKALLEYLAVPQGLSSNEAQRVRRQTTLAASRVDYRHRNYLSQSPSGRLCAERFREDGVLLPFGCDRSAYSVPNPTFFQTKAWPMMDSANPLECFDLPEILKTKAGPATNDVYGKLYVLLQTLFRKFHRRTSQAELEIQVFCIDAKDIPDYVKSQSFARIEVSNICDGGYVGMAHTANIFTPMLQKPADNRYATLITLFLNAVHEVDDAPEATLNEEMKHLGHYLEFGPRNPPPISPNDPKMMAMMAAKDCVRDGDRLFDRYMKKVGFSDIEQVFGIKMKEPHTIIDKWPLKLKLKPGQKGAKEEFDLLVSSGHVGTERYVEWKRMK